MKKFNLKKIFLLIIFLLISCGNDEVETLLPKGLYEKGIILSNEGNFGSPNAEISFIADDLNSIENNVYSKNNDQAILGNVLNTIELDGENAYLVLNNSNKIVVVNRYTFKKKNEISTEINQPRFLKVFGNYIYVTNDAYLGAKYLSIYNKNDFSFVKKIDFGNLAAERILEADGKIFIQNASFGFGNQFSIINSVNNTLVDNIQINLGNITKSISYNNFIYVLIESTNSSSILEFNSMGTLIRNISLGSISNAKNLEIDGGYFYFTSGNKVYRLPINSSSSVSEIFSVPDNSWSTFYGFAVKNGKIYVSDVKAFSANSMISIYNISGNLLASFSAGRGTNGFYFNE